MTGTAEGGPSRRTKKKITLGKTLPEIVHRQVVSGGTTGRPRPGSAASETPLRHTTTRMHTHTRAQNAYTTPNSIPLPFRPTQTQLLGWLRDCPGSAWAPWGGVVVRGGAARSLLGVRGGPRASPAAGRRHRPTVRKPLQQHKGMRTTSFRLMHVHLCSSHPWRGHYTGSAWTLGRHRNLDKTTAARLKRWATRSPARAGRPGRAERAGGLAGKWAAVGRGAPRSRVPVPPCRADFPSGFAFGAAAPSPPPTF